MSRALRGGALVVAALVVPAGWGWCDGPGALAGLGARELAARQLDDARAVGVYREGMARITVYLDSRPDLVPPEPQREPRLLASSDRDEVRRVWKVYLEYLLALDSVARMHQGFAGLRQGRREPSFVILAAAFLAQYRHSLDVLARLDRDRSFDALLDEPTPELGLPAGSYSRVKLRFLNVARAVELATLEALDAGFGRPDAFGLRAGLEEDRERVWAAGRGPGEVLTLKNALKVVGQAGFGAWFPVQAGVAEWMGDTRVATRLPLVTPAQIAALSGRLQPGDILLERREWYLSNVGLPGFWPHAAIYVGTPAERGRFFATAEVRAWVQGRGIASGSFEDLAERLEPDAARGSRGEDAGHAVRVLEAISEGVSFTSLEHSAGADSLAVLRPRLPRTAVAAALLRAFHFAGRPYDFNFDFSTDRSLVCTELVVKAFDPQAAPPGLRLPLVSVLGRPATPANEIVRQLDEQWGTPAQQLDLVLFLDGQEKQGRAEEATAEAFRTSWRRPKWHVLTQ